MLVVYQKPVTECLLIQNFHFNSSLCIREKLWILFLLWSQIVCCDFSSRWIFDLVAHIFNLVIEQHFVDGTHFKCLHGIVNSENDHTSIQVDLLKEVSDECLFFNETYICQGIASLRDSVIETILETILNIICGNHDSLQPLIECITLTDNSLEVCATCHNDTFDFWHITSTKEVLRS